MLFTVKKFTAFYIGAGASVLLIFFSLFLLVGLVDYFSSTINVQSRSS